MPVPQVTAARRGAFEQFYVPPLTRFAARLRTVLAAAAAPPADPDRMVADACADLLDELLPLCSRTLIHELHRGRRDATPLDPTSTGRYDAFVAGLGDGSAVLERHPVLARLLTQAVDQRLRLLTEALDRYAADRADLPVAGPLLTLRCSSGDPHHGGRKVLVAGLAGGTLVYKPRPAVADRLVAVLVAELSAGLPADRRLRTPVTVDRGGHCWQEFAAGPTEVDEAAAGRFFFRAGAFLALFGVLGATDLHYENLIADGEHPLLVDLETVAQHRPAKPGGPIGEAFGLRVGSSVLGTMLLPARVLGSPFDIDMSGLGAAVRQESDRWWTQQLADLGTDAVRLERRAVWLETAGNLPLVGGAPADVRRYAADLDAGYVAGAEVLRERGDRMRAVLADPAWAELPVRQVLRPTAVYGRFLDAATHPDYLRDPAARRALFEKLTLPIGMTTEAAVAIREQEIAALVAGDVPHFTTALGGRALSSGAGAPVPDAYATSLSRQLLDRWDATGRTADADRALVQLALLSSYDAPWTDAGPPRLPRLAEVFADPAPPAVAAAVAAQLAATAIWDGDRTRATWIAPLAHGEQVRLAPHDFTLYGSGGTVLFLAAAARRDPAYRPLALAAAADPVPAEGVSAFTGRAGSVYLDTLLADLLADPGLRRRRDAGLASLLEQLDRTGPGELPDYVGGLAGTATVLAGLVDAAPGVAATLHRVAGRLRSAPPGPAGELAHGAAGPMLALARAAAALDDRDLRADAGRRLDQLLAGPGGAPEPGRSWCRGRAGTALAAALALTALDRRDEVAGRCLPLLDGLPAWTQDVSLCHGLSGQVLSAVQVCRLAGAPDREAEVVAAFGRMLPRLGAEGWRGGLAGSAGMPTFLLGLSGLAYTALAVTDPALPSPLALQLPAGVLEPA